MTIEQSRGTAGRTTTYLLVAIGMLVVSALLQAVAAAQRWVFALDPTSPWIVEDHLYDYIIPLDPWESIGSAAILFGLAYLLIGAALVFVAMAARPNRGSGRSAVVVASITAAPFALFGIHALWSGLIGSPSPVQAVFAAVGAMILGIAQAVGLVVLAVLLVRRSWSSALGVLVLAGTSAFGYIFAAFVITPELIGYQSHDTTPWTEAVLAGITLLAALLVAIGPSIAAVRSPSATRRVAVPSA